MCGEYDHVSLKWNVSKGIWQCLLTEGKWYYYGNESEDGLTIVVVSLIPPLLINHMLFNEATESVFSGSRPRENRTFRNVVGSGWRGVFPAARPDPIFRIFLVLRMKLNRSFNAGTWWRPLTVHFKCNVLYNYDQHCISYRDLFFFLLLLLHSKAFSHVLF